ncbi:Natterin-like protein [Oryzias melastigma]|uniref:Natterin-like protein n=1 Tax=Oryzias melastigma TaxID=30732 RepID=A0A834F3T7_ORYME|nr:Natterin-like protein [Oryzias melastigma]
MSEIAPITVVGGDGGTPFIYWPGQTGSVLKKLEVWVGEHQVGCIKITMSDGSGKTFGQTHNEHSSFSFDNGEYFSSLTLWSNNAGDHLGGIRLKTTNGRTFEAFPTGGKPQPAPTKVDVGSGNCFGVQGRADAEIDAFGFMFIKVS